MNCRGVKCKLWSPHKSSRQGLKPRAFCIQGGITATELPSTSWSTLIAILKSTGPWQSRIMPRGGGGSAVKLAFHCETLKMWSSHQISNLPIDWSTHDQGFYDDTALNVDCSDQYWPVRAWTTGHNYTRELWDWCAYVTKSILCRKFSFSQGYLHINGKGFYCCTGNEHVSDRYTCD